jgi:hypothetical protein
LRRASREVAAVNFLTFIDQLLGTCAACLK